VNDKFNIFSTNKCILLVYNIGASGKFISNCLGFNKNFHIQSNGYFSKPIDQINWLLKTLSAYKEKNLHFWNDMDLGDNQFFKTKNLLPEDKVNSELIELHKSFILKSKTLEKCLENNKFFFRVCHTEKDLDFYKKIWPNSKIIVLTNQNEYIKNYRKNFEIQIKEEFFNFESYNNFCTINCLKLITWNSFYQEYQKLLNFFDCELENINLLRNFYDLYSNITWQK